MKCLYLSLAALFAVFALFARSEIEVEDGVLVLGDDNFEDALAAHKNLLVEFYAPWCGHCKALAPEWAKAAKTLSDAPVKLAKVDATEEKGLATEFAIRGFPTIKFFKNGKASEYTGGRTESEIVKWVNKKTGPPAATVNTEDELLALQEKNDVVVVGAFSSLDADVAKEFEKFADEYEMDVAYAITSDKAVKAKLAADKDMVVVLKNFDNKRDEMAVKKGFVVKDVADFVLGASIPLVQTFSAESSKKIFGSGIQKHVLFFTDPEADYHKATVAAYTEAAPDYKGQLMFINVPSTESRVMEYFGINSDNLPFMVVADLGSESGIKKFPFSGEHQAKAIKAHIDAFIKGELSPSLKSEEVDPADTTGDVVVLRGTSFKDIVLDNEKDVLVEFYAPWCGHCKKLAPVYDEVGAMFKSNSNIVIAKMDATANEIDVPGVNVKGFPTIYFFKGNAKDKPVKYEEGREVEDFVAFLEKNAHNTFTKDEL